MGKYKIEKTLKIDDFECSILGLHLGHRCGYVGLPKEHKYYEKSYREIDVYVHGGLTYDGYSDGKIGISEGMWIIGFDCAHWDDGKDLDLIRELNDEKSANIIIELSRTYGDDSIVRNTDYVEGEIRSLIEQLNELF